MKQKINSIRTWSSRNAECLSKITLFLPLKFEYANYIFPVPILPFMFLTSTSFEFFAKIMGGNCFLLFKPN